MSHKTTMASLEAFRTFNPESDESIDDVVLSDQQFFVFQLAHAETAIRSQDGNPWIRCVGFTRTLDAARALARNAHDLGDKLETRIMPVGRVFLAGRQKYEGLDLPRREEEQKKANAMIDAWTEKRKQIHAQVQKLASEKTVLPDPEFRDSPRPSTPLPRIDVSLLEAVKGDTAHVDMQNAFACAIVPDETSQNEPALIALFAGSCVEDVQKLVKRAARCKDLVHVDIFVGQTGEWLPLHNPSSQQTFHHHPLRQAAESNIRWIRS